LQDPQEAIANQLYGGLLVLAPVGTGKTYALTERVARALYYRIGRLKSDVPGAGLRWPPNPASLFG